MTEKTISILEENELNTEDSFYKIDKEMLDSMCIPLGSKSIIKDIIA